MFKYFLFIAFIKYLYAFEPSCSTCKFFNPNLINQELGLCNMFKDKIYINNEEKLVKNLAIHCRINENLCGSSGFLYEQININEKLEQYENIKNLCNGESIEKTDLQELEDIEKELVAIFQKMRRHNTKRIYKTTNEIYNLFKNRNNQ